MGSALVVASAPGAPGAAAAALGKAAGNASGVNVVVPLEVPPVGGADDSGPVAEGTSGVPGGTLLCARAEELRASARNPKHANATIVLTTGGTRRIRSSTCIVTDYCDRFGSQTSQTVLDIIATRIVLCKLFNRSFARVMGSGVEARRNFQMSKSIGRAALLISVLVLMLGKAQMAAAQMSSGASAPPPPTRGYTPPAPPDADLQAPATSGPIQLQSIPVTPQAPPDTSVPQPATAQFEHHDTVPELPRVFVHQWSTTSEVPPESLISESYLRTAEQTARKMTLKEAIYVALRNNPNVKFIELNPIGSQEGVSAANAAFDPNLTSQVDVIKSVVPATSVLIGATASATKLYDWNFGINKLSAITGGTMGITFNNERALSNSAFASVNPSYNPTLAVSIAQPLLQSFGWKFATINVRVAESGQKQQQWNYEQSLQDLIQTFASDYWNVVLSEENLDVARAALKFNQDLVRQNSISVKVGTLAPLDLQEAESAAATAEANVFTAIANLKTARAQIRQDVMYNPEGTFLPAEIQPSDLPKPHETLVIDEDASLRAAVEYRPSLAGLRETVRGSLLQVEFAENQTLPQLNLGAQIGVTNTAGHARCSAPLTGPPGMLDSGNCTPGPGFVANSGNRLPFGGIYGDALNKMWNFGFYNYAAVLTFQMPIDNASARAALAQARVSYEQTRLQYRAQLSAAVVQVENALANLYADQKRAQATEQATFYARQSLNDENVRFRVGMATTHDLLQFQEEEVAAEGNQVQSFVDLENAKINLQHAQGTLLTAFNINFQLQDPHETPWYAAF
jgi:outer membrane protein TolC